MSVLAPPRLSRHVLSGCLSCLVAGLLAAAAFLPLDGTPLQAAEQSGKGSKKPDDDKPAPPEDITLTTVDDVKLVLTYYQGTKGKDSIPVVLLHGWKGSRKDYTKQLAPYLRDQLGCAVIVPDLRGHGDSTTLAGGGTISVSKMLGLHYPRMVTHDMLAVKSFLWDRNNQGELNIDKLCLVGADMGALVALEFAVFDATGYGQGNPFFGPLKLGRFVKALVLISPEQNFHGLNTKAVKSCPPVCSDIDVMIMVGKESSRSSKDAEIVHSLFKRFHPIPEKDKKDQQTLFMGRFDTKLQGTKMLEEASFEIPKHVETFLRLRMITNSEANAIPWKVRKHPHE